ncbi:MAG TPA: hypothetical protein VI306_17220 [Pyrinomonadaceae bacterium]
MKYFRMTITDTLGFWDDYLSTYTFNPSNSKTFSSWYRVPDDWISDGEVNDERRETLFRYLYGKTWRMGNGDGSQYIVLESKIDLLTSAEVEQHPWSTTKESRYIVDEAGAVTRVEAAAF